MTDKLDEALASLTDKQLKFWELMQTGKLTQVQAYRQSHDVSDTTQKESIEVMASRLWNNAKFKLSRTALMNGITSQTIKAKEVRIAEMQAFAERCEAAGQLGAAAKARELVGKLEGHYIDRRENVNRTRDQLTSLKQIADSLGEDDALRMAKQIGMEEELTEHLASIH